ncbi:hypothetical protein Barb6_02057 [Bacteroidales bacterium Barb6]|nr:hypothetical protein Barb6_02057 [Bacteroidales bacterium Barb6]
MPFGVVEPAGDEGEGQAGGVGVEGDDLTGVAVVAEELAVFGVHGRVAVFCPQLVAAYTFGVAVITLGVLLSGAAYCLALLPPLSETSWVR